MPPKEKRTWFEPIASVTGSSLSPSSLMSSSTVFLRQDRLHALVLADSASAANDSRCPSVATTRSMFFSTEKSTPFR